MRTDESRLRRYLQYARRVFSANDAARLRFRPVGVSWLLALLLLALPAAVQAQFIDFAYTNADGIWWFETTTNGPVFGQLDSFVPLQAMLSSRRRIASSQKVSFCGGWFW